MISLFVVLWGDTKTAYDPCPSGWKVPPVEAFSNWSNSTATWDSNNLEYSINAVSGSWYPAIGSRSRNTGLLHLVGVNWYYWEASNKGSRGNVMSSAGGDMIRKDSGYRARGFAVCCVKE